MALLIPYEESFFLGNISDLIVIPCYTHCVISAGTSAPHRSQHLKGEMELCRVGDTSVPLANEASIEQSVCPHLEGSAAVYALTL